MFPLPHTFISFLNSYATLLSMPMWPIKKLAGLPFLPSRWPPKGHSKFAMMFRSLVGPSVGTHPCLTHGNSIIFINPCLMLNDLRRFTGVPITFRVILDSTGVMGIKGTHYTWASSANYQSLHLVSSCAHTAISPRPNLNFVNHSEKFYYIKPMKGRRTAAL